MITVYNNLTDAELLRKCDERDRSSDPLLQELCNRLQRTVERAKQDGIRPMMPLFTKG